MILSYCFLFMAIFSTAIAQVLYRKFVLTKEKKYYLLSISLFILTPVFSFCALQNLSIDIVYISTALTILVVLLLSKIYLHEIIVFNTYIGVFLIVFGVIVYGY